MDNPAPPGYNRGNSILDEDKKLYWFLQGDFSPLERDEKFPNAFPAIRFVLF